MIENLYKILPISEVKPEWFFAIVEKDLGACKKNNDGTKVVLKIPFQIKTINDVPDIWKADFLANAPYMNHSEILAEMQKPEWITEMS